jgi:hypothetical protein
MAKDAFLDALADSLLRMKVMQRHPATLDDALKTAVRFKALRRPEHDDNWDENGRRRDRQVRTPRQ